MSDAIETKNFQVNALTGTGVGTGVTTIQLNMDWTHLGRPAITQFLCQPPTLNGSQVCIQFAEGKPLYSPGSTEIFINADGDGADDTVNGAGSSYININSVADAGSSSDIFASSLLLNNAIDNSFGTSSSSISTFSAASIIGGSNAGGGFGLYIPSSDYSNIRAYISSKWVGIGDGYENITGFDTTNTVSIKAATVISIDSPLITIDGLTLATSATAGSASALPATPDAYLPVTVGGTAYVIPLYLP